MNTLFQFQLSSNRVLVLRTEEASALIGGAGPEHKGAVRIENLIVVCETDSFHVIASLAVGWGSLSLFERALSAFPFFKARFDRRGRPLLLSRDVPFNLYCRQDGPLPVIARLWNSCRQAGACWQETRGLPSPAQVRARENWDDSLRRLRLFCQYPGSEEFSSLFREYSFDCSDFSRAAKKAAEHKQ
jgi:hypothetical protein